MLLFPWKMTYSPDVHRHYTLRKQSESESSFATDLAGQRSLRLGFEPPLRLMTRCKLRFPILCGLVAIASPPPPTHSHIQERTCASISIKHDSSTLFYIVRKIREGRIWEPVKLFQQLEDPKARSRLF